MIPSVCARARTRARVCASDALSTFALVGLTADEGYIIHGAGILYCL